MHPGRGLGDEFLEEQRRGDGAAQGAAGNIVDVGDLAVEQLTVGRPQGQAPQGVAGDRGVAQNIRRQGVVGGEHGRQVGAQGDPRRAGQGGAVDDQRRLLAIGLGERVGEHQAALGVRIADLHGESLAALDDIEGADGVCRDAVLHRRDQHPKPHREAGAHDCPRQAEHGGGAAHVFLHQHHAVGGLEIEAAAVEPHPLADQGDLGRGLVAPMEIDQPGGLRRGAADRMDQGIARRQQRLADGHRAGAAMALGEIGGHRGERLGPHILGRRVDQVAGQGDGRRQEFDPLAVASLGPHQAGERFAGLAVAGEAITAQRPAQGGVVGFPGVEPGGETVIPFRQRRGQPAIGPGIAARVDAEQHPCDAAAVAGQQAMGAGLGGEAVGPHPGGGVLGLALEPIVEFAGAQGDDFGGGSARSGDEMVEHGGNLG